jgi:Na+/phosphate symporter
MLSPKKNVLKKKNSKYKIIYKYENIINKLKERGDKCLSEFDDNQKIMINSFFSKMLIDDIFEKNNPMATFENNQIIFLFLLDNSILEKYIDIFGYFINIDYILIQLYSIIRKKNISEDLNEKYIHFINKYIDIENVGNYVIRSLNNKKTFENLFKCNNINKKFIFDLFNAIENVINNLSNNIHVNNDIEKAGKNILNILNEIFEHINKFYDINFNFSITEFYLYGKIIRTVLRNLNKKLHYQKLIIIIIIIRIIIP